MPPEKLSPGPPGSCLVLSSQPPPSSVCALLPLAAAAAAAVFPASCLQRSGDFSNFRERLRSPCAISSDSLRCLLAWQTSFSHKNSDKKNKVHNKRLPITTEADVKFARATCSSSECFLKEFKGGRRPQFRSPPNCRIGCRTSCSVVFPPTEPPGSGAFLRKIRNERESC